MVKSLIMGLMAVLLTVSACKKNTDFVPDCGSMVKSFATDVKPIIASSCAISGCHNAGSGNGPGPLTSHAQVSGNASRIRSAIIDGSMPKGATLTAAQKNNIVCWVDSGSPDN